MVLRYKELPRTDVAVLDSLWAKLEEEQLSRQQLMQVGRAGRPELVHALCVPSCKTILGTRVGPEHRIGSGGHVQFLCLRLPTHKRAWRPPSPQAYTDLQAQVKQRTIELDAAHSRLAKLQSTLSAEQARSAAAQREAARAREGLLQLQATRQQEWDREAAGVARLVAGVAAAAATRLSPEQRQRKAQEEQARRQREAERTQELQRLQQLIAAHEHEQESAVIELALVQYEASASRQLQSRLLSQITKLEQQAEASQQSAASLRRAGQQEADLLRQQVQEEAEARGAARLVAGRAMAGVLAAQLDQCQRELGKRVEGAEARLARLELERSSRSGLVLTELQRLRDENQVGMLVLNCCFSCCLRWCRGLVNAEIVFCFPVRLGGAGSMAFTAGVLSSAQWRCTLSGSLQPHALSVTDCGPRPHAGLSSAGGGHGGGARCRCCRPGALEPPAKAAVHPGPQAGAGGDQGRVQRPAARAVWTGAVHQVLGVACGVGTGAEAASGGPGGSPRARGGAAF